MSVCGKAPAFTRRDLVSGGAKEVVKRVPILIPEDKDVLAELLETCGSGAVILDGALNLTSVRSCAKICAARPSDDRPAA